MPLKRRGYRKFFTRARKNSRLWKSKIPANIKDGTIDPEQSNALGADRHSLDTDCQIPEVVQSDHCQQDTFDTAFHIGMIRDCASPQYRNEGTVMKIKAAINVYYQSIQHSALYELTGPGLKLPAFSPVPSNIRVLCEDSLKESSFYIFDGASFGRLQGVLANVRVTHQGLAWPRVKLVNGCQSVEWILIEHDLREYQSVVTEASSLMLWCVLPEETHRLFEYTASAIHSLVPVHTTAVLQYPQSHTGDQRCTTEVEQKTSLTMIILRPGAVLLYDPQKSFVDHWLVSPKAGIVLTGIDLELEWHIVKRCVPTFLKSKFPNSDQSTSSIKCVSGSFIKSEITIKEEPS